MLLDYAASHLHPNPPSPRGSARQARDAPVVPPLAPAAGTQNSDSQVTHEASTQKL